MSLNASEHEAMQLSAQLWNKLVELVGHGPSREADLRELGSHIHAIQHAVMAQSAARTYPERYRLLGRAL